MSETSSTRTRIARPGTVAFALSAIVVVGVSIALTLRSSSAATGPETRRFSGSSIVLAMPSLLASPRLTDRIRAVVVRDDAAASYYDSPATMDTIVGAWRQALAAIGGDVRIARPAELGALLATATVLVVPSSPCLTVATRAAVDAAAARGIGLIMTGVTGAYDAGCREIGYGLMVTVTGASRVERLSGRPMVYVTLPAGSPLTADIPPGARLDLDPAGQMALRLPSRDAFYSDYTLHPLPAGGQPLLDAALARGSYGKSRVVYWGFELRDASRRTWNQAVLSLLVRNSVAWAARLPTATLEEWPNGHRSAAVLALDAEHGFGNARYALDSLRAAGVASTFFLTSELARRNARLTRRLAESGEIGTHSEDHRLLGGMPPDSQRQRLEKTQRDLTSLLGSPARGLRPPQEQFDHGTMAAWLEAGGSYLLGANDSRTVAPELLPIGGDTLVLIARTGGDDFTAVREGRRDPVLTASLLLGEWERVRTLGGAYVLSYHTQVLARPELVPALARLARAIRADTSVWLATAGDVADWWRTRAELDVRLRRRGANRLDVVVRNRGTDPAVGAVVRVDLASRVQVRRVGGPVLRADSGMLRLRLPPIQGGAEHVVPITVAPTKASGSPRRAGGRTARSTPAKRESPRRPWWAPWRW